jgi:hypothetical protein
LTSTTADRRASQITDDYCIGKSNSKNVGFAISPEKARERRRPSVQSATPNIRRHRRPRNSSMQQPTRHAQEKDPSPLRKTKTQRPTRAGTQELGCKRWRHNGGGLRNSCARDGRIRASRLRNGSVRNDNARDSHGKDGRSRVGSTMSSNLWQQLRTDHDGLVSTLKGSKIGRHCHDFEERLGCNGQGGHSTPSVKAYYIVGR